MMEIIYYLLVGQLVMLAFYLGWRLSLSGQKNYVLNRFWLLGGLLMALLPPLLQGLVPSTPIGTGLSQGLILPMIEVGQAISAPGSSAMIDWKEVLSVLYLAGVTLALFRLMFGMLSIVKIRRKSSRIDHNLYSLPNLDSNQAFSFFGWIFIPKPSDPNAEVFLLAHERTHARQWHSLDVIIGEIFQALHWFSPLGKIYLKAIRDNHEYIADEAVLEHTRDRESYIDNLTRAHRSKLQISLVHSFSNQSTLKNRLTMMYTKQSKSSQLLRVLAIPFFIAATFIACSKAEVADEMGEGTSGTEVLKTADVMPEFKGGNEAFMQYMIDNIKYPEDQKESGIEGKVMVSFVVGKDGKIKDAKVVRSVNEALDKAALDVVNAMPDWNPGSKDGKSVDIQMTLPVVYRLD